MYDMDQFKETYITECFELLDDMESLLMQMDQETTDLDQLNAVFRCAHSIKGGGGAFGFSSIVSFTHVLEALLEELRSATLAVSQEIIDALLESVDVVRAMVQAAQQSQEYQGEEVEDLRGRLLALSQQGGVPGSVPVSANKNSGETVEAAGERHYTIHFNPKPSLLLTGNEPLLLLRELATLGKMEVTAHMDAVPPLEDIRPEDAYLRWTMTLVTEEPEAAIREVFEFVEDECDLTIEVEGSAAAQSGDEFGGMAGIYEEALNQIRERATETAATAPKNEKTIKAAKPNAAASSNQSVRVDIDKIDRLVNMVGEIVIAQAMVMMLAQRLSPEEHNDLIQGAEALAQHTRELQEAVMAVRMQPIKSIFSRMTRLVRDLSKELSKSVRLETVGEGTEIDKTVIEQLSDPLTHMIRNSIDHGIEMPAERKKKGKSEEGTIVLSADQRGGRIVIEISDDGGGINRERVLAKAVEKGVVPASAELSDQEIDELIFHPGFSTAEKVTNVSGRGVGMDVVRKNIEALSGVIAVANTPGQGTHFTVSLPLTLAILDGMIIRIGKEHYVIPIASIIQSLRPPKEAIHHVTGGPDVINIRGEFIPLLYVHELFNIADAVHDPSQGLVILVEGGASKLGLVVDEMVNQQQVVVKSIEDNTQPIPGVSSATILGDGRVSLILDVAQLHRLVAQDHGEATFKQAI